MEIKTYLETKPTKGYHVIPKANRGNLSMFYVRLSFTRQIAEESLTKIRMEEGNGEQMTFTGTVQFALGNTGIR